MTILALRFSYPITGNEFVVVGGSLPLCDSACFLSHKSRKKGEHKAVLQGKLGVTNKLFHVYEVFHWAP